MIFDARNFKEFFSDITENGFHPRHFIINPRRKLPGDLLGDGTGKKISRKKMKGSCFIYLSSIFLPSSASLSHY